MKIKELAKAMLFVLLGATLHAQTAKPATTPEPGANAGKTPIHYIAVSIP